MAHWSEEAPAMKRAISILSSLFVLGAASIATAGSVTDTDLDLVPDAYDGCTTIADGPADPCNQVDTNLDGYGNACDPDYDNNGATTTTDFNEFLGSFITTFNPDTDHWIYLVASNSFTQSFAPA